ncbi:MAG: aldehyde dehydrogenase family protein [Asticcacaulis sp.]
MPTVLNTLKALNTEALCLASPAKAISELAIAFGLSLEGVEAGISVGSPIDGTVAGTVALMSTKDVGEAVSAASTAFEVWRRVPAPLRGEFVRRVGEALRAAKDPLALLVTLECGKILSEGRGEVQEMIDICDFATGLSRQLYGLTMGSERPGHHMREVWQPLGPVGVISAFNFPVAVWAWNAAIAWVCGNPVIWKPSEKTPLVALACQAVTQAVWVDFARDHRLDPELALSQVLIGRADVGEALVDHPGVPLISATGSTRMGRIVGPRVAARFGRSLLELGGNNAMIVAPSADLDLALRAIVFSAAGTAGQRCTSLRRLFVHDSLIEGLMPRLEAAFASLKVGDPRQDGILMGPLIDNEALAAMQVTLDRARAEGGQVWGGDVEASDGGGAYVRPALVRFSAPAPVMQTETFAPILSVVPYSTLEQAIAWQNDVPQGLSSCLFTLDLREAETFLSASGSDCGIANINIGPSGAEIGGAFGGEKETGGGRESGSDAWKAYMRRQTQTVNYSRDLPLAQGVTFDL